MINEIFEIRMNILSVLWILIIVISVNTSEELTNENGINGTVIESSDKNETSPSGELVDRGDVIVHHLWRPPSRRRPRCYKKKIRKLKWRPPFPRQRYDQEVEEVLFKNDDMLARATESYGQNLTFAPVFHYYDPVKGTMNSNYAALLNAYTKKYRSPYGSDTGRFIPRLPNHYSNIQNNVNTYYYKLRHEQEKENQRQGYKFRELPRFQQNYLDQTPHTYHIYLSNPYSKNSNFPYKMHEPIPGQVMYPPVVPQFKPIPNHYLQKSMYPSIEPKIETHTPSPTTMTMIPSPIPPTVKYSRPYMITRPTQPYHRSSSPSSDIQRPVLYPFYEHEAITHNTNKPSVDLNLLPTTLPSATLLPKNNNYFNRSTVTRPILQSYPQAPVASWTHSYYATSTQTPEQQKQQKNYTRIVYAIPVNNSTTNFGGVPIRKYEPILTTAKPLFQSFYSTSLSTSRPDTNSNFSNESGTRKPVWNHREEVKPVHENQLNDYPGPLSPVELLNYSNMKINYRSNSDNDNSYQTDATMETTTISSPLRIQLMPTQKLFPTKLNTENNDSHAIPKESEILINNPMNRQPNGNEKAPKKSIMYALHSGHKTNVQTSTVRPFSRVGNNNIDLHAYTLSSLLADSQLEMTRKTIDILRDVERHKAHKEQQVGQFSGSHHHLPSMRQPIMPQWKPMHSAVEKHRSYENHSDGDNIPGPKDPINYNDSTVKNVDQSVHNESKIMNGDNHIKRLDYNNEIYEWYRPYAYDDNIKYPRAVKQVSIEPNIPWIVLPQRDPKSITTTTTTKNPNETAATKRSASFRHHLIPISRDFIPRIEDASVVMGTDILVQ